MVIRKVLYCAICVILLSSCSVTNTPDNTGDVITSSTTETTVSTTVVTTETTAETENITTVSDAVNVTDIDSTIVAAINYTASDYADAIKTIIEQPNAGFAMGGDFGLYDVNADGTYEIIVRVGMFANLTVYDITGNVIWHNVGSEAMDSYTTHQTANTTLYYGVGGSAFSTEYTVEPMDSNIRMYVYVNEDALGQKTVSGNVCDLTNADINTDFIQLSDYSIETVETVEDVNALYVKYFGDYTLKSDDDILNKYTIVFDDDMNNALYAADFTGCEDKLVNAVQTVLDLM